MVKQNKYHYVYVMQWNSSLVNVVELCIMDNILNIHVFAQLYQYTQTTCELTILTHRGRVTHICVSKQTIIGSDNGLSPGRRHAIIWTNAGILLIWPSRTNFSEISIDIQTFSFKKIHFKMSSGKRWPFCLGLSVFRVTTSITDPCRPLWTTRIRDKVIESVWTWPGITL